MKTKAFIIMAAVVAMAMTACDNHRGDAGGRGRNFKDEVYTGVLPAADAAGVKYVLHLEYDDDHGYTDGDYKMYETYYVADSSAMSGQKDVKTFRSEGDFTVNTGIPSDAQAKYIKLVPDVRDSSDGVSADPVYFQIVEPNSLIMLNSSLEAPARAADYTLTAK